MMDNANEHKRSLLHDQRGAAMVEAAIMLPIFILIFGSVMYMSKKYDTAVKQAANARHCAWIHAKNSCDGNVPSGCAITEGVDVDSSEFASNEDIQAADDENSFFDKLIDLIAGKSITAETHSQVSAPSVLGGGNLRVAGRLGLSCNEKSRRNLGEAIEAAWDAFADF